MTGKTYDKHVIDASTTIKEALGNLNQLAPGPVVLFVVNDKKQLIGSISDGDIRRSLIDGAGVNDNVDTAYHKNPTHLNEGVYEPETIELLRQKNIRFAPVLNANREIVDFFNLDTEKSKLPLSAVIMAGGKGTRLLPLTEHVPKPLLEIGGKPIMQYNLELLRQYGVTDVEISVNHFKDQIIKHFGTGEDLRINLGYIEEDKPLGTIGSITKAQMANKDYVLLMNSDLLTNVNLEDMYDMAVQTDSDIVIASIPYKVQLPYAILEEDDDQNIVEISEKPSYTYFSNAGIYLIKTTLIDDIPRDTLFNATDLVENTIKSGGKVKKFKIIDYWLDIGKHDDFKKAQEDIKHINF